MRPLIIATFALFLASPPALARYGEQAATALRVVVIDGEDAVNVIQQKTSVAPVVEVRDRNDQPVAGAIVNFAIRSGRATFGGARTLSVTTNAAGRAVATGFAPTGSGALQISATAAFQGQTAAAVTIAQTTVETAAQAAAMTGATGAGGSSGAAGTGAGAGGGGSGLSATTIGIIGGAAAAGVIAAKELGVVGGGKTYSARFSGTLQMVFGSCRREEQQTGTIEMQLSDENGSVTGSADVDGEIIYGAYSCGNPAAGAPQPGDRDSFGIEDARVTGSASSVTFSQETSNRFPAMGQFSSGINAYSFAFTGSFNGTEITGILTVTRTITDDSNQSAPGRGTITYSVTLR